MLRNRLYYSVKPLIPWSARSAIRSWFACRKRRSIGAVWPILPGSEKPPVGWCGWPDGKQFAVVLTHDVEGPLGLAKCRQLMQIEMKLGFRSSFNLIPEGSYIVPRKLRDELTANGFEVGVHDLNHDGKLYRNRAEFSEKARRINYYLKEWGAVGFRSGFMLHNLEWAHDLEVIYEASTFDTDPFEPQPEGVGTIFPFWVPGQETGRSSQPPHRRNSAGYVELPYTLVQDSTLFLVLKEPNPDIWFQKLDWIARHGGMALLDTHPDYMGMSPSRLRMSEYPVAHYEQTLKLIRSRYEGSYWHGTAAELAEWFKKTLPCQQKQNKEPSSSPLELRSSTEAGPAVQGKLSGKRAAVLVYSYFTNDNRPLRAAEALVDQGMEVDVICLRDGKKESWRENCGRVKVLRLPIRQRRGSKALYLFQYLWFTVFSFTLLSFLSLSRRYSVIHVHNMPDLLVFAAIIPRLQGAKIVLDLHDPMPELAMTLYHIPAGSRFIGILRFLERWSVAFADLVLTPNLAFHRLFISRSCSPQKMHIVMNSPQPRFFDPALYHDTQREENEKRPFTVMFHGLLTERNGLHTAITALLQLRSRIPRVRLVICGTHTPYFEKILEEIKSRGLVELVTYRGYLSQAEIAKAILASDVGIIPNQRTPFTEINLPTRIFENLAMGRPVIAPRTTGVTDYFAEDEILFFDPGDAADLAVKLEWVQAHPAEVAQLVQRGRTVLEKHRWQLQEQKFTRLIVRLLENGTVPRPARVGPVPKRICMLSHSVYDTDNRVRRYAEALARRGDSVEVFALKLDPDQTEVGQLAGVTVHRIGFRSRHRQKARSAFLWPILRFCFTTFVRVSRSHLKNPYDLVHVHNVPDFLVFAAVIPKLRGAKIILDIHDILPEFYVSKFGVSWSSPGARAMRLLERFSASVADHLIVSNHLWREKYAPRTRSTGRCSVFINNVDDNIFRHHPRTRSDGKLIVVFPGGLHWHQGLDIAIRAFRRVCSELPNAEFHIYGFGPAKESLVALASELGLEKKVRILPIVTLDQVPAIIANADLGVVPKRADSFGNEAYSTKIMEFMSLGVPVVVSSTAIDRYYFDDSVVRFFESGNVNALADAMIEVLRDQRLRQRLARNGLDYAARNNWQSCKADYLGLVDALISGSRFLPVDAWDRQTATREGHCTACPASEPVGAPPRERPAEDAVVK